MAKGRACLNMPVLPTPGPCHNVVTTNKTTDVAQEAELLAGCNLVPNARTHDGIDPLNVARAGNRHAPRALKLQTKFAQIDGKRAGQAQ